MSQARVGLSDHHRSPVLGPFLAPFVLVAALLAMSCGGNQSESLLTERPTRLTPEDLQEDVPFPDSPAGSALEDVFDSLNGPADGFDEAFFRARFTDEFIDEVGLITLGTTFTQLAVGLQPLTLVELESQDEYSLVAVVRAFDGTHFRILEQVEYEEPYRLAGLLIQPAPGYGIPSPINWEELELRAVEASARVSVLAAEIEDGACAPIYAHNEDVVMPLGSAFKLYVLGALADAIDSGAMAWEDVHPIDPELQSLPSGRMQDDPPGTTYDLFTFAQQMIAISDNTATDHLIALLGREAIEANQAPMGHSAPELNRPFLLTREFFALKLTPDGLALLNTFRQADPDTRRELLESEISMIDLSTAGGFAMPTAIDSVEWFATSEDLCRAMVYLRERGQSDPESPVMRILSRNPGLELDENLWTFAGYKGGSEPGVLNLTWLLQRRDGRWFFLSLSFADDAAFDTGYALAVGDWALELLGYTR